MRKLTCQEVQRKIKSLTWVIHCLNDFSSLEPYPSLCSAICPTVCLLRLMIRCWEKEMATHSSILAWRILWTEEPGRLLSMGLHRTQLKRLSSSSSSSMIRWVPAITVHYSTTTRKSKSSNQGICSFAFSLTGAICCAVLSHSVMSSCLPPHGL